MSAKKLKRFLAIILIAFTAALGGCVEEGDNGENGEVDTEMEMEGEERGGEDFEGEEGDNEEFEGEEGEDD
jgi:hypothetical protein